MKGAVTLSLLLFLATLQSSWAIINELKCFGCDDDDECNPGPGRELSCFFPADQGRCVAVWNELRTTHRACYTEGFCDDVANDYNECEECDDDFCNSASRSSTLLAIGLIIIIISL